MTHPLISLPTEIWLNIIFFVEQDQTDGYFNTIKNLTIIKPDLFHLTSHCAFDTTDPTSWLKKELAGVKSAFMEVKKLEEKMNDVELEHRKHQLLQLSEHFYEDLGEDRSRYDTLVSDRVFDESKCSIFYTHPGANNVITSRNNHNLGFPVPLSRRLQVPDLYYLNVQFQAARNEFDPRSQTYTISDISGASYPNLHSLILTAVENEQYSDPVDNGIKLENIIFPNLKELTINQLALYKLSNLHFPNLESLTLISPESTVFRERQFDENFFNFVIDQGYPFADAFEIGLFTYFDCNYTGSDIDLNLRFDNLKNFHINVPFSHKPLMELATFIHFLTGGIIPYQTLEILSLQLTCQNAENLRDIYALNHIIGLNDIITSSVMKCLDLCVGGSLKSLKLDFASSLFLFPRFVLNKVDYLKSLDTLCLANLSFIEEVQDEDLVDYFDLPKLKELAIAYAAVTKKEQLIMVKSVALGKLSIAVKEQHLETTQVPFIEYLDQFQQECPNISTLVLSFHSVINEASTESLIRSGGTEGYTEEMLNFPNPFFDKNLFMNWSHLKTLKIETGLIPILTFFQYSSNLRLDNLRNLIINLVEISPELFLDNYRFIQNLIHELNSNSQLPFLQIQASRLENIHMGLNLFSGQELNLNNDMYHTYQLLKNHFTDIRLRKYPNLQMITYRPSNILFDTIITDLSNTDVLVKQLKPNESDEDFENDEKSEDLMMFKMIQQVMMSSGRNLPGGLDGGNEPQVTVHVKSYT